MVNAVAGSFSERVPVLVISGGPGEEERRLGMLIHHQAKEIESQLRIYQELTCAARVLDDPRTAAESVHDVVQTVWREQQPGYLEIHRDMVERPISCRGRSSTGTEPSHSVARTSARWRRRSARRRSGSTPRAVRSRWWASRPFASSSSARCASSPTAWGRRSHHRAREGRLSDGPPALPGVHIGPISPRPIVERVDRADLVLNLGTLLTDMNLGSRPPSITRDRSIWAVGGRVNVSYHTYTDVHIRDFVRGLMRVRLRRHREPVDTVTTSRTPGGRLAPPPRDRCAARGEPVPARPSRLRGGRRVGRHAVRRLDVRVERDGGYLAQGYYASMGFGVPGALGAEIATGLRPLVLCGDGAFQMTGPEIAHAPRYGLKPIVLLINNGAGRYSGPSCPSRAARATPVALRAARRGLGRPGLLRRAHRGTA